MCIETIKVEGVGNPREAYEVSEYLKGHPSIDDVKCDFLSNDLIIDYNEHELDRDMVLDEIEYAGCRPTERKTGGFFGSIKRAVSG